MLRRVSENLLWTATTRHVPQANFAAALANTRVALQLDPLIAARPNIYKSLVKKIIASVARREIKS